MPSSMRHSLTSTIGIEHPSDPEAQQGLRCVANGCKMGIYNVLQVQKLYSAHVLPFLLKHSISHLPEDADQRYQLYLWATAVVSGYSFSLGEDKFQAMVSDSQL